MKTQSIKNIILVTIVVALAFMSFVRCKVPEPGRTTFHKEKQSAKISSTSVRRGHGGGKQKIVYFFLATKKEGKNNSFIARFVKSPFMHVLVLTISLLGMGGCLFGLIKLAGSGSA